VEVRPVGSRRELREFIELPFRLHSSSPQWIPPLRLERHAFLSRRLNAYARHGEWRLFLARRDGRVAGRISAQVDHAFNAYHGNRWGMFGFLELEDDPEVMRALLAAATGWLRERRCERMVGPMDFSANDELGVLVDGHDLDPIIRQPWHPPHYQRLCEDAGLEKEIDVFFWYLHIADREQALPILFELSEAAERDHGVRLRKMSRRTLRRDLDTFAEIYNDAWRRNWGFVPYGKEDLDAYAQELQLVFDRDWFMVAEIEGEPVGVAITVPDVNQALRRMHGRLLPLGWWHFLRRRRYIDRVRVGFLGVKEAYQHTGVAARLYVEHFDLAATVGPAQGETGWILETNTAMNKAMEAMHGRIVKRYRIYQQPL
jgi:GNAT superfamily N-acetyltransferase